MFNLPTSYSSILSGELDKPYFKEIVSFLKTEKNTGKVIYPEEKNVFRALELTDFDNIKVVILGQDPYHQESQAHGLSFSVPEGVKIPPSLRNIYKEIDSSVGLGKKDITNGNLEHWAKQGVLLLNSVLTVEDSKPASHSKIGWETFTDDIIMQISIKRENVVFLLWGAFAKSKNKLIDGDKHLILETSHPSPLGSYRGFLGSKCFLETNRYLKLKGKKQINW